jgi:excisionase family DNA binding protein
MSDILTVALSVQEAAAQLGLSRQTVTRLFEKEPGVIVLERSGKMHKRKYTTLRIPRHVYDRVIGRLSN